MDLLIYLAKIAVMYITRVPNRNSPPAVLLRESYRGGGKVKNRTVANLSSWAGGQGGGAGAGTEGPAPGRAGKHVRDRPQLAARARGRSARHHARPWLGG